jgi:hypothetical protein
MKKKVSLELNKETVQVLEKNELNSIQGGEATSQACAASIILASIAAGGVDLSWWACEPNDGDYTGGTKGSQEVMYGGCLLCEAVVD